MAYVVIVFCMINVIALVALALIFLNFTQDILTSVETVILEEVRKQDDRIEKRLQRAAGPEEDSPPTPRDGLVVGQPLRR